MGSELEYEEQRLQNIRDNEALLLSLGLFTPSQPKLIPTKKAISVQRKSLIRKRDTEHTAYNPPPDSDKEEHEPVLKTPRRSIKIDDPEASGRRRSLRNSEKKVDYKASNEGLNGSPLAGLASRGRAMKEVEDGVDGRLRNAKKMGLRTQNPKKYGHIRGVEVGKWWATRMDASTDAVHAPTVAGISGNAIDGAYSVALSGGYPDDIDLGVAFTYTGCGGRDLKGTKQNPKNLRTAPQTSHQTFDWPMNAALKKSAETRKPVRVIRGYKLPSPYAPIEGYRYDGLYIVEKAWMGKGLTKGLMVCRYAFKRVPGQPELSIRDLEAEKRAEEEGQSEEE